MVSRLDVLRKRSSGQEAGHGHPPARVRSTGRHPRRSSGPRALVASLLVALLSVASPPVSAAAQEAVPTKLVVRAVAHDAKVIGSGVGGARITVRDAETGQILARGVQRGGTGDTDLIMRKPRRRGGTVYDTPGTASFTATLMLEEPTRVQVTAEAPLGAPRARQTTSKTLLMVPGHDVAGEGLVLPVHGFLVEILSPEETDGPAAGESVEVRARVQMMCGCPTRPAGLWNSDRYELLVRVLRDGRVLAERPLAFTGETSVYAATVPLPEAGPAVLEVLALDPGRANAGVARRTLRPGS